MSIKDLILDNITKDSITVITYIINVLDLLNDILVLITH